MKIKITKTRYNLAALMAWAGLIFGLLSGVIQYFHPSVPGLILFVVSLIGCGIAITFSGSLKTVSEHWVDMRNAAEKKHKD